jgi:hypothetical protein
MNLAQFQPVTVIVDRDGSNREKLISALFLLPYLFPNSITIRQLRDPIVISSRVV